MVGAASLNSTRLATNPVLDQVHTTSVPDPEKRSRSVSNRKEVPQRIKKIEENGAVGIEKTEAAALVWSKNALWATYAWYTISLFSQSFGLHEESIANDRGHLLGSGYPVSCWCFILRLADYNSVPLVLSILGRFVSW
ncbi:hypothetical protein BDV40DRAFT_276759 [Aspergillus tamarii]|uniref:Major facilitator superfamily domain-containing protein n=1 Tax=Aspergillus tamarii TaxID=41984 RepID=A0A5N6UHH1_ASPTM|nr:hypothetical protein BDV40DRAFT_276759 [Aspergillus tamarii]